MIPSTQSSWPNQKAFSAEQLSFQANGQARWDVTEIFNGGVQESKITFTRKRFVVNKYIQFPINQ
jgi:hypothetical protein